MLSWHQRNRNSDPFYNRRRVNPGLLYPEATTDKWKSCTTMIQISLQEAMHFWIKWTSEKPTASEMDISWSTGETRASQPRFEWRKKVEWHCCISTCQRTHSVKSIPPNTEKWLRKRYDENDDNNMSNETKRETNYSTNNKWNNNTRNMHITWAWTQSAHSCTPVHLVSHLIGSRSESCHFISIVIHERTSLSRFSSSTSTCPSLSSSFPSTSCTASCTLSSTTWSPWKAFATPPKRWVTTPTTSPPPSQVMSPTSWPSASSTTLQVPSPTLSRHRTRTWMTWHSSSCSQRHTEDKPITANQKACQSVSRRRVLCSMEQGNLREKEMSTNQLVLVSQETRTVLTASFLKTPKLRKWSIEQGNLWEKAAEMHRLGLYLKNRDRRLSQNTARKLVITNSKQLMQKKSAEFYEKNYGDRNWNFVKFINKILQRWRNYENSRVLPSIRSQDESSSRTRTLFWNYQAEYKNYKMK